MGCRFIAEGLTRVYVEEFEWHESGLIRRKIDWSES